MDGFRHLGLAEIEVHTEVPMNPFVLLFKAYPYITQIMSLLPMVQRFISRGLSINAIKQDLEELNSSHLIDILKDMGLNAFPAVRYDLQVAAGAVTVAPDYVMKVQKLLNENRFMSPAPNLDVDGYIGPKTKAAVRQYQQIKGLTVDEYPGDATMAALLADAAAKTAVIPVPEKQPEPAKA
jgi:peptidoglycan hydrolase-like protein with peptidoglycan-binding domain